MNRVSVYIIAYNEAEKIRDAIHSVLWADEIVLAEPPGHADGDQLGLRAAHERGRAAVDRDLRRPVGR